MEQIKEKNSMKYKNVVKNVIYSVLTLSLLGLLFMPAIQQKSAANDQYQQRYLGRLKEAMTEVNLSSAESIGNFVQVRSGLEITPSVANRLNQMEALSNARRGKLISYNKFIDVVTDLALDKASKLTDEEVDKVITSLQGFRDPNEVKTDENPLTAIRPGKYTMAKRGDLAVQLKAMRRSEAQLLIKGTIRNFIEREVHNTLVDLVKASPENFGEVWDFKENRPGLGLKPNQVFLLTYSLVSGDLLTDNQVTINKNMEQVQQEMIKRKGKYPSPLGHKAYGDNGYLYSSPVNILFNETEQMRLLDRVSN
jgi:hypothetical protein